MPFKLVIGNKAYSSWSLRPWILMTHMHIPFEETVINIYDDKGKRAMRRQSPTGKVPVLIDGETRIWESLAIMEYLHEAYPDKGVWPKNKAARAHARAISSEMHAGFQGLRQHCPTNFIRDVRKRELTEQATVDAARIDAIWTGARKAFGEKARPAGPFLFGRFCAADAMFAPVVNRLHVYDVKVSKAARAYMEAVRALPAWQAWHEDAAKEKWRNAHYDAI
jgi:glutathione S-transferase